MLMLKELFLCHLFGPSLGNLSVRGPRAPARSPYWGGALLRSKGVLFIWNHGGNLRGLLGID